MNKSYVVAVSGGVDSVVLLDMVSRVQGYELRVAHFDHGIRPDSADDARFVAALAKKYQLPYVEKREELGAQASEELARNRRYRFLRDVAQKHKATIITAHHADDIVETIAINLKRGTGWRGLAVLGAGDIERPLVTWTKQAIYEYACRYRLEWVEDNTNKSHDYLRNQFRALINRQLTSRQKENLLTLWSAQTMLKETLNEESDSILRQAQEGSRYLFIMVSRDVAVELLRRFVYQAASVSLTYPQLEHGVLAIKTGLPGTKAQLGSGVELVFTKTTFIALRGEKML